MLPIADSSAYWNEDRMLPQHQAALTLLQRTLADPSVTTLRWLDLACGRGQIIAALDRNLSLSARSKITYYAYDVDLSNVLNARRTAERLELAGVETVIGILENLGNYSLLETQFDFIYFTNTVHEVSPDSLAQLILECVYRLSPKGCLFIYDMESITPPELGAVPWTAIEFREILTTLLGALGTNIEPEVGRWRHRSCNGWNAQIHREHFGVDQHTLEAARNEALIALTATVRRLLYQKLTTCKESLEHLTKYIPETAEEVEEKTRQLYSFWALSRALGVPS